MAQRRLINEVYEDAGEFLRPQKAARQFQGPKFASEAAIDQRDRARNEARRLASVRSRKRRDGWWPGGPIQYSSRTQAAHLGEYASELIGDRLLKAQWKPVENQMYRCVTKVRVLRNTTGGKDQWLAAGDDLGSMTLHKLVSESASGTLHSRARMFPRRIDDCVSIGDKILFPRGPGIDVCAVSQDGEMKRDCELLVGPNMQFCSTHVGVSPASPWHFVTHSSVDGALRWWDLRSPERPTAMAQTGILSIKSLSCCAENIHLVALVSKADEVSVFLNGEQVFPGFPANDQTSATWNRHTESFEQPVSRHSQSILSATPIDSNLLMTTDGLQLKLWSIDSGRGLASINAAQSFVLPPHVVQVSAQSSARIYILSSNDDLCEYKVCRRTQQIEHVSTSVLPECGTAEGSTALASSFDVNSEGSCVFVCTSQGLLFAKSV